MSDGRKGTAVAVPMLVLAIDMGADGAVRAALF